MTRTLSDTLRSVKNRLEVDDPIVILLTIDLLDKQDRTKVAATLRLARYTQAYTYDGNTYQPFPFAIGDIEEDTEGNLHTLELSVTDLSNIIKGYMEFYEFDGAEVTISAVWSGDLLVGGVETDRLFFTEKFDIRGWRGTWRHITFVLGFENHLKQPYPVRRAIRHRCSFVYKGLECAYSGDLPTCDFSLSGGNGCEAHANQLRFGGFPSLPFGRDVV